MDLGEFGEGGRASAVTTGWHVMLGLLSRQGGLQWAWPWWGSGSVECGALSLVPAPCFLSLETASGRVSLGRGVAQQMWPLGKLVGPSSPSLSVIN